MGRKSGGHSTQTVKSQVEQSSFPKEMLPYLRKQMGMADALLQSDYIPYGGQRLAGFTPQEQAAFTGVQAIAERDLPGLTAGQTYFKNLAAKTGAPVSGTDYLGVSSGYTPQTMTSAYSPTAGSFGSGYGGADFSSGYGARDFTSSYQPGQIQASFQGANIDSDYRPGEFQAALSTENIDKYMNPYTERVLDTQLARRQKEFKQREAQRQAQGTVSGGASAFGGRGLLEQQTAQRGFDEGTAGIEAAALDKAYQQALTASSRDIDRDLRVQQLRDQAERTRAQARTGALESTARFAQAAGAQGLQAQIASDAAARAAGQMGLTAQQYADRSAQTAAKLGLTAQQYQDLSKRSAGEQLLRSQQMEDAAMRASGEQGLRAQIASDAAMRSKGEQGLRAAMANQKAFASQLARRDAASKYGVDLDKTEQAMDLQRAAALAQAGQDIRGQQQRGLDMAYQDFMRQRDYPKEMLSWYSNLLRGNVQPLAPSQQTTTYGQGANTLGQLANLGMGALALNRGRVG